MALNSPQMIPHIWHLPHKEFSPLSQNFNASVQQVLATIEKVVPETAGVALAVLAGPAHTRSLQYAQGNDINAAQGHRQAIDSLNWLKGAIRRKELAGVPATLDEIIRRLHAREFPDLRTAALAREVIEAARVRKKALAFVFCMEVYQDPSLRPFYDQCLEGWERPMKRKSAITTVITALLGIILISYVYPAGDPTNLIDAIRADDAAAVKRLIAQGADPEQKDYLENTPVILCAAWGSLNAVKALLDCGANVNARHKFGGTALMVAAALGNDRMVKLLLAGGANIDDREEKANPR